MNRLSKYISPLLLLIASVIWGFAFTAQKAAVSISPFTLGALRSAVATVFLLLVIPVFDRVRGTGRSIFPKKGSNSLTRPELIGGTLCGVLFTAATAFQQFGLDLGADAGKASFITALYVAAVPIYSLILGKRSTPSVWLGVLLSILGFYLLCITRDFTLQTPDLLVLACALVFAVHIMVADKFSPVCDGVRMSSVQFAVATLLNGALALAFERDLSIAALGANILPVLYLGIASSGIAYTLQIIGQRETPPAASSIILSLESVFGVIGAALMLGERMTLRESVGAAVVFLAVVLAQIDFSFLKKRKEQGEGNSEQTE